MPGSAAPRVSLALSPCAAPIVESPSRVTSVQRSRPRASSTYAVASPSPAVCTTTAGCRRPASRTTCRWPAGTPAGTGPGRRTPARAPRRPPAGSCARRSTARRPSSPARRPGRCSPPAVPGPCCAPRSARCTARGTGWPRARPACPAGCCTRRPAWAGCPSVVFMLRNRHSAALSASFAARTRMPWLVIAPDAHRSVSAERL